MQRRVLNGDIRVTTINGSAGGAGMSSKHLAVADFLTLQGMDLKFLGEQSEQMVLIIHKMLKEWQHCVSSDDPRQQSQERLRQDGSMAIRQCGNLNVCFHDILMLSVHSSGGVGHGYS